MSYILGLEEENEEEELKKKFHTEFHLYLEAFLNDEKSIIINGKEF